MTKYVIDAYAWIEYLAGSAAGEKVKAIVENLDNEIFTHAVTVSEIVSKVSREGGNAEIAYEAAVANSNIISADEELAKDVGMLHASVRKTIKDFGLADAFVLLTARKHGAKVVTADQHFKGFKEAEMI